ncbi:(Fe-S)-binding protein [Stieleria varia]|uniref:Glycolate oxidase iron-sulfur subunit n=1 Tax=Stieleria varia TaxID=2528005 RepID=A0A5C6AT93_9BACT|nr:heterodisulfide reductase-related iron-sulfur binding cluster [Stieleria varia]TWU02232.1 Lactate utilization protein A [Stieleria varia]
MRHEIKPDEHGPMGQAMADAVSTCVHCGFCLAACPTYKELQQETDSPRGRIILMKEVLEGTLPLAQAAPHIDACLGCLACEPACPSGVKYGELISPFRALTQADRPQSLGQRFQRTAAQMTLPYPGRFRLAALMGRFAKPIAKWLPGPMRVMLDLLPAKLPSNQTLAASYPSIGKRRGRVALLTGCAQTVLDPDINLATIDVLTRNGVEVVLPQSQGCCGALSWHVGNHKQATKFAVNNLHAFPEDVDAIVTNAAGCGSGMHEYPLMLRGTEYEDAAKQFASRVCDVSVYLSRLGELLPIANPGRKVRVAYHDACHLANAQGIRREPRSLLHLIPGIELVELVDLHLCCGSAGTYSMDQPEIAASLGQQKADRVIETGCDYVATGNIGCMTQLANHLQRRGSNIKVRHTVQIIRDAYEGELR